VLKGTKNNIMLAPLAVKDFVEDGNLSFDFCVKKLRELIEYSLAGLTDLVVGIGLSGGTDSSLIVSLLSKMAGIKIKSYCVGFGEEDNEFNDARIVADLVGTDHKEILVDDLMKDFPLLVWQYGEPKRNLWPYYLLKRMKDDDCDIVIGGQGGDELFGGYRHRYEVMFKLPNRTNYKSRAKSYLSTHARDWVPDQMNIFGKEFKKKYKKLCRWDTVLSLFYPYFKSKLPIEGQVFLTDYNFKLRYDFYQNEMRWAEILGIKTGAPFLNDKVRSFATHIPYRFKYNDGNTKIVSRKILKDLGLPSSIVNKRKYGFGINPVYVWSVLKDRCKDFLKSPAIVDDGWINQEWIDSAQEKIVRYLASEKDAEASPYINKLWDLLAFEIFYQQRIVKRHPSSTINGW